MAVIDPARIGAAPGSIKTFEGADMDHFLRARGRNPHDIGLDGMLDYHRPPQGASGRAAEAAREQALEVRVKQAEALTGLEIELDREGVDDLLPLSSHEVASGPEMVESVARITAKAGKTWTISTEGFEATNVGIQLGNRDVAAPLVSRIVNAAEKLGVETVISPDCGHPFQALRWEGPNLLGRAYPFEVRHIIEVLDQFRAEGLLKSNGEKEHARIAFRDPCEVARRGGVIGEPRNLLNMVADDCVETENAGAMNWCCSGGGGVGANQRANALRRKAFGRKRRQIEAVAPDKIVAMRAFCRATLEDQLEINEMDNIEVASLTEMMAVYQEDRGRGNTAKNWSLTGSPGSKGASGSKRRWTAAPSPTPTARQVGARYRDHPQRPVPARCLGLRPADLRRRHAGPRHRERARGRGYAEDPGPENRGAHPQPDDRGPIRA